MFGSLTVCLLMLHQAGCQTQSLLYLRQQDLADIPELRSAHKLPPRLLFWPRCWKATYSQALKKSEQCAGWITDTESLFQLTTCFQNLDRVYWPPLRSGMRQLTPNPVVITLSMWTSLAGMMGFEKSWKYWCKTKVSEWKLVAFFGFVEISYGGEILKYFNDCIIQNRNAQVLVVLPKVLHYFGLLHSLAAV